MHICHVYKDFYPPVIGGIEKHIALSVKYQKQWAKITVLVCSRQLKTSRTVTDNVEIISVGELGRILSSPIAPLFPLYLRNIKPDLFIIHSPNPLGELSVLLNHGNIPYVVRYHSDVVRQKYTMKLYSPLFYNFLKKSELIIPTSDVYANNSPFLSKHLDKCKTIPLGIETNKFGFFDKNKIDEIQRKYGSSFVFFCGVHRYYKGIHVLIQSANNINVPIVIAGDGPERRRLEDLKKSLSYDNVFFIGQISDDDLINYLHACSLFVFPSIARSEAFGLSIIEAHSVGKPVIATKLGTGVEFANLDGITGINVPPNDSISLSNAISFLLEHPEIRIQMGKTAKERVEKEFNIENTAKMEFDLYRSVVGK